VRVVVVVVVVVVVLVVAFLSAIRAAAIRGSAHGCVLRFANALPAIN
jgi:hypothetical protein